MQTATQAAAALRAAEADYLTSPNQHAAGALAVAVQRVINSQRAEGAELVPAAELREIVAGAYIDHLVDFDAAQRVRMRKPKTLAQLRAHPAVASVDDERHLDNGWWVILARGYWCPPMETHQIHEDTIAECLRVFGDIEPCACDECVDFDGSRSAA